LVVAGGGQLDEEWGGPWGHPYALFKWTLAARLMRTPVVFLSVGACHLESRWTRAFLRAALRTATYRSYRDERSRQLVATFRHVGRDRVVPDLAFSLTGRGCIPPVRPLPSARGVVGIAPIAFRDPRFWPNPDRPVYVHYIRTLAEFVSSLMRSGYSIVMFYSDRMDRRAVDDLVRALNADASLLHLPARPELRTVADLRAQIETFDYVVASRLHSVILSHAAAKPTLAISFDPKVDTHMGEFDQRSYCLDIHTVDALSLIEAFDELRAESRRIAAHLTCVLPRYRDALRVQYDRVFGGLLNAS
jgi:polysaccharide pyruvyl transferase WcaK-like protein